MMDILTMVFPFLILILALYFFIIMPQQREEKRRREMIQRLQRGDKVVTESGIVGTFLERKNDEVIIEVSAGVLVRFKTWAIREAINGKKN
jgi:preprotein translocase subunit YajC